MASKDFSRSSGMLRYEYPRNSSKQRREEGKMEERREGGKNWAICTFFLCPQIEFGRWESSLVACSIHLQNQLELLYCELPVSWWQQRHCGEGQLMLFNPPHLENMDKVRGRGGHVCCLALFFPPPYGSWNCISTDCVQCHFQLLGEWLRGLL